MLYQIILLILSLWFTSPAIAAEITISSSLTSPATLYVCAATGAPCNTSVSNTCLTTSDTCPTLNDAFNKLKTVNTDTVTIEVASGTYSPALINSSAVYVDKQFAGTSNLIVKGHINSTPNLFTDSSVYSGTSSGSNQSLFPVNATTEDYTYLNVAGTPWTTNAYVGHLLHITGGTGYISASGLTEYYVNWYVISSNTSNRLTLVGRYVSATPDATTTFEIFNPANAPTLSGTGAQYGVRAYFAENIYFALLNIVAPNTGTISSTYAVDSKNVNFVLSRINGGNNLSYRSRVSFNVSDLPIDSSINNGITGVYYSNITLNRSYLYGYRGHGVLISSGSLDVSDSWIKTDITTGSTDGFLAAAIWEDVGASLVLEQSRIEGMNSTAFNSTALLVETESSALLKDNVHVKGRVNTSRTSGIICALNARLTTRSTLLVSDFYTGITVATGGNWASSSTANYSGNTINSIFEPNSYVGNGLYSTLPRSINPTIYAHVWDEFVSGNTVTAQIGSLGWLLGVSGTGTISVISSESSRPGLLRLDTGATSTSDVMIQLGQSGTKGILPSDMFDELFYLRLNSNDTDTMVRLGLENQTGVNPPNNGIYIEKLLADTSWYGVTRSSSSETRTSALAATGTSWVSFRIRRVDSSTIGFSVNGGAEVLATATVPTIDMNVVLHIKNNASAAKTIDIDYFDLLISGLVR